MDSSLRLSDLDTSTRPARNFSPSFRKSKYSELGQNNLQLSAIQKKSSKIKQYETTIYRFETKLQEEKRKVNFSFKETFGKLDDEESQIEKQYFELQETEKNIQLEKINSDKLFSEQKLRLLELEDESKRLAKSNEWANSTFSFKKSSTYTSDSVLQMKSQLSQVKMQIRDLRSKIFHYQKELLRISEAKSPVKSQQYILQSRIDDAKSLNHDSNVKADLKKTMSLSVNEQALSFTKCQTEKKINQLQSKIQELQSTKNSIMNKLLSLRSTVNDSLLESIREQANQYKEATTKQKKLQNERFNSSRSAISRQLDIEVELDGIKRMKEDILKQQNDIDKVLKNRQEQITNLEKTLLLDDEIVTTGSEAILDELIRKIQNARFEEHQIEINRSISSENVETDCSGIDKNAYDHEHEIIEQNISNINREIEENGKEMENLKELLNKENEKQAQISDAITTMKSNKVIVQTPKIKLLNEQIDRIQNKIEKRKKKIEKKTLKIKSANTSLEESIKELESNNSLVFLKIDMFERILRSMNWIYTQTKNSLTMWRSIKSITLPTLNDWESKILLAAMNETEDLNVRYSILCK